MRVNKDFAALEHCPGGDAMCLQEVHGLIVLSLLRPNSQDLVEVGLMVVTGKHSRKPGILSQVPPHLSPIGRPEADAPGTLETSPSPILRCLSRQRIAALRLAVHHDGGALGSPPSPRARGGRGGGAKIAENGFSFPIRSYTSAAMQRDATSTVDSDKKAYVMLL
jgi:hypothetical protein